MIRRNWNNKIRIPWYRRIPVARTGEDIEPPGVYIGFRFPNIRPERPNPGTVAEPVTAPATEPVKETGRVRVPDPSLEPVPVPIPRRVPEDERQPEPFPGMLREPQPSPYPQLPGVMSLVEISQNWEEHFRRLAEQYAQTEQGRPKTEPQPVSNNPFLKAYQSLMEPVVYLIVGQEMVKNYVEAKITDPIYARMLEDPVLGRVLREAEKANLDMEKLANYFANYDWEHMNIKQMTQDLVALIGAAGAARLIIFFIGRKVLFRI